MNRALSLLIGFLVVSAIYLYAFPQPNVLYAGVVLLHALAGVVASVFLLLWLIRCWRQGEPLVRIGMVFLFLGAIPGLVLIYTGALRTEWTLVYVHIGVSFLGAGLIAAARLGALGWLPVMPRFGSPPYWRCWRCSRRLLDISARTAGASMPVLKIPCCPRSP